MHADLIGWISAAILVMTLSRQVYTQWRARTVAGVSKWLFVGQSAASLGFATYSFLLENWVFVFANCFLFLTGVAGELVYMRNRRLAERERSAPG